jgi:hypothetical protein
MSRQFKWKEAALAFSIALPLVLHITEAAAFSTESATPPQNGAQAAPAVPLGQSITVPGKTPEGMPADALGVTGKQNGTEVTIPGIGSVGSLPQLDFGLELLYGSKGNADSSAQFGNPEPPATERDLQIKGTLKHSF